METEFDTSRVERLKRGLYSQAAEELDAAKRGELSPSRVTVEHDWSDADIVRERRRGEGYSTKILKILVVCAVLTAFASGGFLLYQLFDPFSRPSDKHIEVALDIPVGVRSGDQVDITVRIKNENRVGLENANLTLLYPSGTRTTLDAAKEEKEARGTLGEIREGQTAEWETTAVFLGEENSEKEIEAVLEYRFAGISSVFSKRVTHKLRITASPVNLTVDLLKDVNSGQPIELTVTGISNTGMPLSDVLAKIKYPLGFTYTDAEPKPTFGNDTWKIGTMETGKKFTIKVRGVLTGEDTEERVFQTQVGVGSDKTEREISTVYAQMLSPITLRRPFIGIDLMVNDKKAEDAVIRFGQPVSGTINWRNNLPDPNKVLQAEIEVKLRGVALDRQSVSAGSGGFYRSIDDTIFWDQRGATELAVLDSRESGSVQFSFRPLPPVSGSGTLTNPWVTVEVTVRGKRLDESGVTQEIRSFITTNVRVTSEAQFTARSVYYTGPFANTGPIPPRIEKETTYTIIMSIVNTANDIDGATVRGVLPPYAEWTGSISPSRENIVYIPSSHEVIWTPGAISAGTGVTKAPREVAFQVLITPSLSQRGQAPAIFTNITFTAKDTFTGDTIEQAQRNVTTNLSTDPKAPSGSDIVGD